MTKFSEFFRHNFVKNENFDILKRRALAQDNSARYDTRIIRIRLAVLEFWCGTHGRTHRRTDIGDFMIPHGETSGE